MNSQTKPGKIAILINLIFFQLVWLAIVSGPGIGIHWLGLPAIIFFASYHFYSRDTVKADAILVAISVLLGLLVETVYLQSGILDYAFNLPSQQFAPYWILILWANFALTLNTGLRWLHDQFLAAAALGFVGAPLAYFSGVKLGAATVGMDPVLAYLGIAVSWAVVTPILLLIAGMLLRKNG